jgi:DivIVA domain-containing protein
MDSSQSALDSLRTVEFRETLKGYHRDDVDEYLEKAAVEAEGLQEQLRQSGERLRQAAERISQLETALEQHQQQPPQPTRPRSRPPRSPPSPTSGCGRR